MRTGLLGAAALLSTGCVGATPQTTYALFERQVGRTVADVTLVANSPDGTYGLPDGRRAFVFDRPVRVPTSPERCLYTVYAELEGQPQSLAAWRVVEVAPAPPNCTAPPATLVGVR
jgi:hypothetical protein